MATLRSGEIAVHDTHGTEEERKRNIPRLPHADIRVHTRPSVGESTTVLADPRTTMPKEVTSTPPLRDRCGKGTISFVATINGVAPPPAFTPDFPTLNTVLPLAAAPALTSIATGRALVPYGYQEVSGLSPAVNFDSGTISASFAPSTLVTPGPGVSPLAYAIDADECGMLLCCGYIVVWVTPVTLTIGITPPVTVIATSGAGTTDFTLQFQAYRGELPHGPIYTAEIRASRLVPPFAPFSIVARRDCHSCGKECIAYRRERTGAVAARGGHARYASVRLVGVSPSTFPTGPGGLPGLATLNLSVVASFETDRLHDVPPHEKSDD